MRFVMRGLWQGWDVHSYPELNTSTSEFDFVVWMISHQRTKRGVLFSLASATDAPSKEVKWELTPEMKSTTIEVYQHSHNGDQSRPNRPDLGLLLQILTRWQDNILRQKACLVHPLLSVFLHYRCPNLPRSRRRSEPSWQSRCDKSPELSDDVYEQKLFIFYG